MTNTLLTDWENLVRKQMKTDDIYPQLKKENLENIEVKPNYSTAEQSLPNLPKIEESTHLVAKYQDELQDQAFAFLVENSNALLQKKSLFVSPKTNLDNFTFQEGNRYFSLIDVFNDEGNGDDILNKSLAEKLLAKPFEKGICVDVTLHQNAGASIIQQIAVALAKTKELAEVFGGEIFSKIIIKTAIGGQYFFEMAKVRALKLVFNQLSKEFGVDEIPYIFAETSQRNKAKNDEENNLIRSTLELSSAMIGGADAVFTNDYKVETSNELSQEISYKQQIVLAYESIINVFEDAGNGSYYVEEITQQLAEKSWKLFVEIEEKGGYLECLKNNSIQKMIYEQAIQEQNWVEEGKIKLIGVNMYPKLEKKKNVEEMYSENTIKPVRWAEMFE